MWHRIADLVGDDCGFQEVGQVKVAENDTEMQTLREREKTMRAAGREHEEVVDAAALRRLLAPRGVLLRRKVGAREPSRYEVTHTSRPGGWGNLADQIWDRPGAAENAPKVMASAW